MRRVAHVPQPHRVVGAARGQRLAVRAERDRVHRVAGPVREPSRTGCPGRLTSHSSTTRWAPAAARIFPSGAERGRVQRAVAGGRQRSADRHRVPGRGHVPQPQRPVRGGRREQRAVRAGADGLDYPGRVEQPGGGRGAGGLQQARRRLRGVRGVVGGDAEVRGQRRVLAADLVGLDGDLAGAGVVAGGGRRLPLLDASIRPARRRPGPAPPARRPGAAAGGYGGVRRVRPSARPRPMRR